MSDSQPEQDLATMELGADGENPALDAALSDVSLLACHLLDAPVAVALCAGERGLRPCAVRGTERRVLESGTSLFNAVLLEGRPVVCPDTTRDDRFASNPLVMAEPAFRFLAAAPLWSAGGGIFGALVVMDYVPRNLSPGQLEALRALADEASRQFQTHAALGGLESSLRAVREEDAALRATNAALRALIDATPTAIVVLDDASHIRMWSARAEALSGGGDRPLSERLNESAGPEARIVEGIMLAASTGASVEVTLTTRLGVRRDLRVNASILRDEWGKASGYIGILDDVTETRRAERRSAAHSRVTAILAEAPDVASALPRVAEALRSQLDWDVAAVFVPEGLQGTLRLLDAAPLTLAPQAASLLPLADQARSRAGAHYEPAVEVPAEDDEQRSVCSAVSMTVPGSGGPVAVLVLGALFERSEEPQLVARLSTIAEQLGQFCERKRIEEERDQFFSLALEMLCILGTDGRLLRLNAAWSRCLGYEIAELEGRSLLEFVHPEDRAGTQDMLDALATGVDTSFFEHRFRGADGLFHWLSWTCPGVRPGRTALYATVRDVTDQKASLEAQRQTEEQRRHAQRLEATGRLAGWTAHYFNNLLTAILGYSRLLLDRLPEGDVARDYARHILSAGERTAGLTQQLLAFSRRQVMRPALVDVNDVVDDMERLLRPLLGAEVELVVALSSGLGRVLADRAQLEQVLLNLVLNARDALPKGGRIVLSTRPVTLDERAAARQGGIGTGEYVEFCVEDSGVGMDPDVRAKVFEPFFTTKRLGQGTGLGLSMVYGIIQQSRGSIRIDSEPGQGTRVEVLLPIAEEQPAAAQAPSGRPADGRPHILLVEDESAVRELTAEVLRQEGFLVSAAESAEAALRLASEVATVDVLVTDVVLPGMSGRQLTQGLLALHPRARVLYMSGYATEDVARMGVSSGEAFLAKPFTPDVLVMRVRSLLQVQVLRASG